MKVMRKNMIALRTLLIVLVLFTGCSKDANNEASQTAQCLDQVKEFDTKNDANPARPCSEIVADIDAIEKTCSDFLSEAVKDEFRELRSQCENG